MLHLLPKVVKWQHNKNAHNSSNREYSETTKQSSCKGKHSSKIQWNYIGKSTQAVYASARLLFQISSKIAKTLILTQHQKIIGKKNKKMCFKIKNKRIDIVKLRMMIQKIKHILSNIIKAITNTLAISILYICTFLEAISRYFN